MLSLIGPSGCGKTTLLSSLNRLTELTSTAKLRGRILLDDVDIRLIEPTPLRRRVTMVFQQPDPFPMSVFDNIADVLREQGSRRQRKKALEPKVHSALERAGLFEEVKDNLDHPALRLSGGQQQRLCIARALAAEPEVLLLDEPCSALDPQSTQVIEDLIVKLRDDVAVVIVTHNLQQAYRIADHVAFMYLGDLVEYAARQPSSARPARNGPRSTSAVPSASRPAPASPSPPAAAAPVGAAAGCSTTQEKAAKQQAESKRILEDGRARSAKQAATRRQATRQREEEAVTAIETNDRRRAGQLRALRGVRRADGPAAALLRQLRRPARQRRQPVLPLLRRDEQESAAAADRAARRKPARAAVRRRSASSPCCRSRSRSASSSAAATPAAATTRRCCRRCATRNRAVASTAAGPATTARQRKKRKARAKHPAKGEGKVVAETSNGDGAPGDRLQSRPQEKAEEDTQTGRRKPRTDRRELHKGAAEPARRDRGRRRPRLGPGADERAEP